MNDTNGLDPFRRRIDRLDEQIARLLGERFQTCREVALYKREHGIAMMQPDRVVEVRERQTALGAAAELPPDFTAELFELVIDATCRMEDEIIASGHVVGNGDAAASAPTDAGQP